MTKNKKYSVKKVTVAVTSILMGISASSFGIVYAQDNDTKPALETKHNDTEGHLNKPIIEEKNLAGTSKPDELNGVAPKIIEKPTEKTVEPAKDDKIVEEVIGEKVDWNAIDGREFLNYIISEAKADKNKEYEIKVLWLTKIKDLLTGYPNNENLQKIKTILEEDLKKDSVKEEKTSGDNREISKDNDKKEVLKEEKISEDKKNNMEVSKDNDKKEVPKKEKVSEDKKDNIEVSKDNAKKEISKATSDKIGSSNDKKQEVLVNNTPVRNKVLLAKLSGGNVSVSFDENKINADNVFVGAINDEKLNKEIVRKLGADYKIIEIFEIHFEKDGKKLDSDVERTVKVSVMKSDDAKLEVYHIADNNVLEKVDSSFSDGVVQFKINHFSKFTILERIRVGAKDLESRVQIVTPIKAEYNGEEIKTIKNNTAIQNDKKAENIKKENEDLPKTGLQSVQTVSLALLSFLAAIAIRRKQKQ